MPKLTPLFWHFGGELALPLPPSCLCLGTVVSSCRHTMAPSRPRSTWRGPSLSEKGAVAIMPAPTLTRPAAHPAPAKKKRRVEKKASPASSPGGSPPPDGPTARRRAPALERLPRWLFVPRRHFVAAHGALPLPARVAVRGKPFYDWDAWALALLAPDLWRRRGPWQRLIACCTAAKPPHVGPKHVPDVKAALVRIVVAEVVSQLVSRNGDSLTPEDRNWITSVASRQRGRHARKPTLMLLFDLAFAVFDLAAFCRRSSDGEPTVLVETGETKGKGEQHAEKDPIEQAIDRIVAEAWRKELQEPTASPERSDPLEESSSTIVPPTSAILVRPHSPAVSVDPVIRRVLHLVHQRRDCSSETWRIDNVNKVIEVIEKLLSKTKAQRWHHHFTSKVDAAEDGIMQAAKIFARRLPLKGIKAASDGTENDMLSEWLLSSLNGCNWAVWAELANDCNYIILNGTIPEERVRELVCRHVASNLLANSDLSIDDQLRDVIVDRQAKYDETMLTLRRLFDMALGLEQFYSFFVETYGNETAVGNCITWGVLCFEGLLQLLGRLRDVLIMGTKRERAMIDWSARSLDISNYYREAVLVNHQMGEDIERAIQSAFSEASWSPQTRAIRFMVQAPPSAPSGSTGSESENSPAPRFWVASLNLSDPVYLAAAIVPWDPQRSLQLLDQAIGLSQTAMKLVCEGHEGLPLWDFRRISICRLLLARGNFAQARLVLERLQVLFDQMDLHVGGNFSADSIPMLEEAVKDGNFCAQTTHGLLLAGQGAYWDVARSWANCDKSIAKGIEKLYLSAVAGDLEACTAFSHILAQCGPDSREVFDIVGLEQVYALMKIAVTSQNANAVMNMGVIWRYGSPGLKPNDTIAIDAFLMALQGGISGEARSLAAKHLAETIGEDQAGVSAVLSKLTSVTWADISSASSPYRIDDFCGSSQ